MKNQQNFPAGKFKTRLKVERIRVEGISTRYFAIPGDSGKAKRYVKVSLRKPALQKTAGRCTYPGCNRPAEIIHHKDRFANSKFTENPHESIIPICKIHHKFAHNGIIKNEKSEVSEWQLQLNCNELDGIDELYRKYRKVAG